jgi:hypothetical protein
VALIFLIAVVTVVGIGAATGLISAVILRRSDFDRSLGKKAALMGGAASVIASLFVAHRPMWEAGAILAVVGCAAGLLAVATSGQSAS